MKVYTFCLPAPHLGPTDVCGFALSEEGDFLASHVSSSPSWSRADMARAHIAEAIAQHPGGPHEVEWVEDPDSHEGLRRARELNKTKAAT